MATFDSTTWMPPNMDQAAKDYWAALYPDDPHAAAAAAWESYAATLEATGAVDSVQTGAQSIRYAGASSPAMEAAKRATWHRARSRVRSVEVGPTLEWGYIEGAQVIETYDSPSRPAVRYATPGEPG